MGNERNMFLMWETGRGYVPSVPHFFRLKSWEERDGFLIRESGENTSVCPDFFSPLI
jgi:hypothetical protein